jgi:hypothetical protein
LNAEIRGFKTKNTVQLAQNVWQDPALLRLLFAVTSIYENILLPTVTVHIAKQNYLALGLNSFDKPFSGINGWMQDFIRELPSAVQVASSK